MSISSLILRVQPKRVEALTKEIARLPGCEVHAWTGEGQMVVTVDEPDDGKAAERFTAFDKLEGVLSTSLVYTQFDQISITEE